MPDMKKIAITAGIAIAAMYVVNNFAPDSIKNAVNNKK